MRRLWLIPMALSILGVPALAQEPGMGPEQLRQQIMQRFLMNYRTSAGLTDEQFEQFSQVAERSFRARGEFQRREREIIQALEGQMRPGVAADEDSLVVLMDALVELQTQRVEQGRTELAEYAAFLTPVQQAQLVLTMRRFMFQIEGVRRRMQQRGRQPGMD